MRTEDQWRIDELCRIDPSWRTGAQQTELGHLLELRDAEERESKLKKEIERNREYIPDYSPSSREMDLVGCIEELLEHIDPTLPIYQKALNIL